jgi:hypothetical protein
VVGAAVAGTSPSPGGPCSGLRRRTSDDRGERRMPEIRRGPRDSKRDALRRIRHAAAPPPSMSLACRTI